MAKRYYWLKLHENFFERDEIKIIEMQPNGEKYINFYLKLLLKSVSTEGRLMFRNVIPYTPEMLSRITNTDVDTARVAIDMFVKLGLMDKLDDGALFMNEIKNMIGSETEWAEKKRKQRKSLSDKDKQEDNVPKLSKGSETVEDNVRQEIRDRDKSIEKDIDIDEDKEINKNHHHNYNNFSDIAIRLEKCGFGISSPNIVAKLAADVEIYGLEWVLEAIEVSDTKGVHNYSFVKTILENWKNKGKWDEAKNKKEEVESNGASNELEKQGIGLKF
ncbi:phage replisome organizer N-terminal domain-containing protein [Clostridium senegalense]|uniref:phage replisome organizer N-terminal domain-containing protein n=1 Tax=Clostridium senegalense TaxID=1465809 RepID=UPI001C115164|nr:phage replisome organizer N-terminal domain-containing protein [Clostridium senegalense]MBU5227821.1 phage replisome organizer N-terminal domain-containing protein [Clostridium senegalense]